MKIKKLAICCCAALLAGGTVPAMTMEDVYADEYTISQEMERGMIATTVSLDKRTSKSLEYEILSNLSTKASSVSVVISLQKYNASTGGWETKSTKYASDSNVSSFVTTGIFDISNYGSGRYRIYVSGKDTSNGITTNWTKMTSNTVNM